jgi:hypothetical protein
MPTLPGEQLRDSIAQLLRMKYQIVVVEKRLQTTTADVFFVDDTNILFQRTIAIEAKDWKDRLSSQDIATIYNLYAPSLQSREIDFLWIIGRHPLSSSPKLSVDKLSNVRFSTFSEFQSSLMNFHGLLRNNILLFEHDDASSYFVETRVRNSDQTLLQYVDNWLLSDQPGLIVYGGYGLGKTTFSLYLASLLSKKYLARDFDRIPIRISLGGMYSKQDLTALICSALSGGDSGVSVKDFSYGLFLEMNRNGQYILILDGFDEMRHAMDLDDFIFTFEEMKPLFSGLAKVVILGRPDSFLTTQEENQVLSALVDEDIERGKKLQNVEVAFFTKSEILKYLDNYMKKRTDKLSVAQMINYQRLINQLPDSEDNILSRPVQLKMFTKIFDECISDNVILNRYELYRKFIYRFIARESQKAARQPKIDAINSADLRDDRAAFMQSMAWWILNTKKENRFLAEEIPINLIPASIRTKKGTSAAIREALVGSVIEPISRTGVLGNKARRFYYFPHKSYLEFLVANYFESGHFSVDVYRQFMININNEILTFLEEGPATGIDNLRQGLMHSLGSVDHRVIEVCATDNKIGSEINDSPHHNYHVSHIYTHYFYMRLKSINPIKYLLARLSDSVMSDSALATYNCIAHELASSGDSVLARALFINCISNIHIGHIQSSVYNNEAIKIYRADLEGIQAAMLSRCVSVDCEKRKFVISIDEILFFVQRASRGLFYVQIPFENKTHKKIRLPEKYVFDSAGVKLRPWIGDLLDKATGSPVFPVKIMGELADRFG